MSSNRVLKTCVRAVEGKDMTSVVPVGLPVQCVSLCCRRRDGVELTLFPAPAFSTGLPLLTLPSSGKPYHYHYRPGAPVYPKGRLHASYLRPFLDNRPRKHS